MLAGCRRTGLSRPPGIASWHRRNEAFPDLGDLPVRLRAMADISAHNLSPLPMQHLSRRDLIPEGQPSGGVPLVGMRAAPAGGVTIHSREASGTALGILRSLCEELAWRLGR